MGACLQTNKADGKNKLFRTPWEGENFSSGMNDHKKHTKMGASSSQTVTSSFLALGFWNQRGEKFPFRAAWDKEEPIGPAI